MYQTIFKADILAFWPLSLNIDDGRVNPYILRAQDNQLAAILGPELCLALITALEDDPTPPIPQRLTDLWEGVEYVKDRGPYKRKFPGVKELLCAYAYSYLVDQNAVHVTRGGVTRKAGEGQENLTTKETGDKSQTAYSEAIRLEGEFYDFMSMKQRDYPEFYYSGPAKAGAFNFFNASRSVKYGF